MAGFNLTAQLQLQAPTNTANVANQIQRDLGNVNVNVNVKADQRAMSGVNSSLKGIRSNAAASSKGISTLNRNLAESARRFSVITVATGTFIAFARSIKNSVGNAIQFEREMIKIAQVTGKSVSQLQDISKEVTRISTNFGVANQTLLETARVLTQAGLSAKKTKDALQVLANTTLAPTFDNIRDTAEGAIAILNQFGREAAKVGQDIKFLEQSLDAINAVSKKFAVESADLIAAVRRTGGVFQAAGGQINELIALFTSVRATTRESAETIATGFRTIFTRVQRSETIDQLKQLGIELTDVEGKFIGPLKAIEALSVGLAGLDPRDVRFNEIVEQLGGFRQIGKVIPLLKQFATAQNALAVANASSGSTARDAIIAQQSLAVQFSKVKEKFDALVRTFASSETFQGLAGTIIKLATAFLKFAETLERVLPQLTTLAALKIGRNIAPGLLMLAGGRGRSGGGVVSRFASGGMVPGSGNRDTVPAMLTPGEFVIRKSSVKKMGADKLAQMNNNRYAKGGKLSAAKFNRVVDGDSLNIAATPEGKPYNTSTRLIGYDAYELNSGTKRERELGKKAKKMAQRRYGSRKSVFNLFKGHGMDKYGRPMYKDDEFGEMMLRTRPPVATRYGGTGARATKKKKALGGLIQRFALGGIANVSRVGAAILQEDQGLKNQQFNVGVTDVKKAVGGGSGSAGSKLRKGVGSQFKGKKYTLVAQGLGKTTSEGFREALIDGVATGLDTATGSLGADLGLGQATLDSGSRNEFKSYIGKRPIVGDLFEAALSSLSGKGKFAESQVSAPFDFPGGLSGAVKDNYNKLPSSWIDAKSSSVNATAAAFKTKVTNELADEYKRTAAPTKKAAKGGSIAGSDTVPAMLTPGEFVFSKSASQKIGYSALNKMNKHGVSGYAAGGVVSHGRHAYGDFTATGLGFSGSPGGGGQTQTQILAVIRKVSQTLTTMEGTNNSIKTYTKSAARRLVEIKKILNKNKSGETNAEETGDTVSSELVPELEKLGKIICDCIASMEVQGTQNASEGASEPQRTSGGSRSISRGAILGGAVKVIQAPFKAIAGAANLVAGTLQRVSSGLIALSFISGTVVQAMGNLSEAQKAQIQAGLNSVSVFAAIGAEVVSFGLGIVGAIASLIAFGVAMAASAASAGFEIAGRVANTASMVAATISTTSFTAALGGAIAALVVSTGGIALIAVPVTLAFGGVALAAGNAAIRLFDLDKKLYDVGGAGLGGIIQLGLMAYQTASEMERLKQSTEKFNTAADKLLENLETGQGAEGDRAQFIALRQAAAIGEFQRGAIGAQQFSVPFIQGGGAGDESGFNRAMDSLFGRALTEGTKQFQEFFDEITGGMGKIKKDAKVFSDDVDEAVQRGPAGQSRFGPVSNAGGGMTAMLFRLFKSFGFDPVADAKTTTDTAVGTGKAVLEIFNFQRQIGVTNSILDGFIKEIDGFASVVGSLSGEFAAVTYDTTQALVAFKDSLQRADIEGLDTEQRLRIRAGGAAGLLDTANRQRGTLDEANAARKVLANLLQDRGLITATGARTEKDAQDAASEFGLSLGEVQAQIAQFGVLDEQANEARAAFNKTLQASLDQEAHIRQDIVKFTGERINKLLKQGDISDIQRIDPTFDSDPIIKAALEDVTRLIEGSFKERIRSAPNQKVRVNLEAQMAASLGNLVPTLKKYETEQTLAALKVRRTAVIQELALLRNKQAIDDTTRSLIALNNFLLGASRSAQIMANLEDELAIARGEGAGSVTFDTRGFDVPLEQLDMGVFTKVLETGIEAMTPDGLAAPLQEAAEEGIQRMADRIKTAKFLIDNLEDFKVDIGKGVTDLLGVALQTVEGTSKPNQIDAIYRAIVEQIEKSGFKAEGLRGTLQSFLEDAFKDNKFDEGDLLELNKVLNDAVKENREAFKGFVEQVNKFSESMGKLSDAVIEAERRFNEAQANVVDVRERGLDRIADFTEQGRSASARERSRREAANLRLGPTARGLGARAGDVAATARAAREAQQKSTAADREARAATLGSTEQQEAADEAKKFGEAAKRSKEELKRMTEQSARASDAMKKQGDLIQTLEKLRSAFDQTKSFLQDFAFGTVESREETVKAFRDLQLAMGQGSMRGATGEQRGRIGGLLDQLSDVTFATGETGAQMKGRFATQELIDLGFDPQFAAQAGAEFAKGPIQKQILKQLEEINREEEAAAQALADLAQAEKDNTATLKQELGEKFRNDLSAAITTALKTGDPDRDAKRAAREQKLIDEQARLATGIDQVSRDLEFFTGRVEDYTKILSDLIIQERDLRKVGGGEPTRINSPSDRVPMDDTWKKLRDLTREGLEKGIENAIKRTQHFLKNHTGDRPQGDKLFTIGETATKAGIDPKTMEGAFDPAPKLQQIFKDLEDQLNTSLSRVPDLEKQINVGELIKKYMEEVSTKLEKFYSQNPDHLEQNVFKDFERSVIRDVFKKIQHELKQMNFDFANERKGNSDGTRTAAGKARGGRIGYFNRGGRVQENALMAALGMVPKGTDTIPAMLTPGEFVINAKAAKKIGYGRLNQMNYMKDGGMGMIKPSTSTVEDFIEGGWTPEEIGKDPIIQGILKAGKETAKNTKKPTEPSFWKGIVGGTGGHVGLAGKPAGGPESGRSRLYYLKHNMQNDPGRLGQQAQYSINKQNQRDGGRFFGGGSMAAQWMAQTGTRIGGMGGGMSRGGLNVPFHTKEGGGPLLTPRQKADRKTDALLKQLGDYSLQQVKLLNQQGYLTKEQTDMLRKAGQITSEGTFSLKDPLTKKMFQQFGVDPKTAQGMSPEFVAALIKGGGLGGQSRQNLFDPKSLSPLADPLNQQVATSNQMRDLLVDLIRCTCGETELTRSILAEQKKIAMQGAADSFKSAWDSVKSGFKSLFDSVFGKKDAEEQKENKRNRSAKGLGGMRGARHVLRAQYGLGTGSRDSRAVRARKHGQPVPSYLRYPGGHGGRQGMWMPGEGGGGGGSRGTGRGTSPAAGGTGGMGFLDHIKNAFGFFKDGILSLPFPGAGGDGAGGPAKTQDSILGVLVDMRTLLAKLVACTCGADAMTGGILRPDAAAGGSAIFSPVIDFLTKTLPTYISDSAGKMGSVISEQAPKIAGFIAAIPSAIRESSLIDVLSGMFGSIRDGADDLMGPKKAADAKVRQRMEDDYFKNNPLSTIQMPKTTFMGQMLEDDKPNMVGPGPQDEFYNPNSEKMQKYRRDYNDPDYRWSDPDLGYDLYREPLEPRMDTLRSPTKAEFRMQELEKVRNDNMYVSSAVSMDEINKVKGMDDDEFEQYKKDPQKAYTDQLQANRAGAEAYDKRDMSDTSGLFAGQTKDEKEAFRRAGTGVKSQSQLDSQMQGFIDATKAATKAYENDPRVKAGTKPSDMSKQDRQEVSAKRKAMKAAEAAERSEATRLRKKNQDAMEADDSQADQLRRGRAMAGTETETDPLDKYMSAKDDTEARRADVERRKGGMTKADVAAGKAGYDPMTGKMLDTHSQDQVRELRRMDSNMRTSATRFLQTGDGVKSTKFKGGDTKPVPVEVKADKTKDGKGGWLGNAMGDFFKENLPKVGGAMAGATGTVIGAAGERFATSTDPTRPDVPTDSRLPGKGGGGGAPGGGDAPQQNILSCVCEARDYLKAIKDCVCANLPAVADPTKQTQPSPSDERYEGSKTEFGSQAYMDSLQKPPARNGGIFGDAGAPGSQGAAGGIGATIADAFAPLTNLFQESGLSKLGPSIDNMVMKFSELLESVNKGGSETTGISHEMNHTFQGELTLAVKMPDDKASHIQQVVGEALQAWFEGEIPGWVEKLVKDLEPPTNA